MRNDITEASSKRKELRKTTDKVKKAMKGDSEAFSQLMEDCKLSMYKTSLAILKNDEDAADAMQETLLACWINMPKLKKPEFFCTWMTRILINKCYDIRRKNLSLISSDVLPEASEEDREIERISGSVMDDVAENYSVILNLYYGSGFSVKDISALTGLSESGVKTRLSRGRLRFFALLPQNSE